MRVKDRLDILKNSFVLAVVVFGLAVICSTPSAAEQPGSQVRVPDEAPRVFVPDAERLASLREQPAFRYEETPRGTENVVQRIQRQIREWFASLFDNPVTGVAWSLMPYLLLIAAVAGIIFILIGNAPAGIFRRRRDGDAEVREVREDVHSIDFDREIERAAREGRFKEALRLMYLQVLKKLTDAGRIRWRPEKTNREYVVELQDPELRQDFTRLTRIFEYIWYGDFQIERPAFQEAQATFASISKRISQV